MNSAIQRASLVMPIIGLLVLLGDALGFGSHIVATIVLVGIVLAAVHHAEVVAHKVGEPFGTLTRLIHQPVGRGFDSLV